ncbi:MAG: FtsQ-type POTRA domain-containing protein [Ktedonobacteraceae bacterium]|nr:FtsQ-type POTRA domain-containing protein [Ktedonobacteraceae bacterium]MBV9021905.1 FtsQ-type POTRA domain-containing protein [Ktedonobacteraceae bacterium]
MTEKRRLPEQIASHIYQPLSPVGPTHLARRRREEGMREPEVKRPVMATHKLERAVTIPQLDPSTAWNTFAQRQAQLRRARAQPQQYTNLIPRAYVQTGMRATSGRVKTVRPLPRSNGSAIPVRSGRRTAKHGVLHKLLSIFAIGIVLLLMMNFVFGSNALRIEQVHVVGIHNQMLMQNIQRMGMQGQNIFLINVAALTKQIQAYPLVASAMLSKQWPNQITVTVVERTPLLLWQTKQGTYSVDGQGVVIAASNATTGVDHAMTVVDMRSESKTSFIQPGSRLNAANIAFALDVFTHLPQLTGITLFKLRYDEATPASGDGTYTVEAPEGWLAYLGGVHDLNPLENRLIELQQVLALVQKQQLHVATIDVRYGLRPVYTLKS